MKLKILILFTIIFLLSSCFNIRSKRPELSAEDKIIKQANSRLYNKIRYGSVRDLEYYIERGAKVDKPIPLGMNDNPLIHAIEVQKLRNAWYLLSQNCDITSIDKWGNNALMWAMYRGSFYEDLAIELIKRGSDVTITNKVGDTPFDKRGNNLIEYAGRCRSSIDIVKLLFEKGAKVTDRSLEYCIGEERGSDGIIDVGKLILDKTIEAGYDTKLDPLVEAVMLNNIKFVQSYIKNMDKTDDDATKLLRSTLKYMSALGYSELLEIVIKFLDNPDDNYTYEVTVACWYDQITSINTLIKLGTDIKQLDSTETPLMIVVRHNNKELTKLLLDNGAILTGEKNEDSFTGEVTIVSPENVFLKLLTEYSDVDMFKLLAIYGFDLDKTRMKIPMDILHNKNSIGVLTFLINNGFNVNNYLNSWSLVSDSCFGGFEKIGFDNYSVFKWIVDNGADLTNLDKIPVNFALEVGGELSVKKTKYLLEHGATIDKKSIIYAIDSGYLENVKMIIDAGADIYRYSYFTNSLEGRNALQIASESGYLDIVKYFISLGMNPSYPAKDGDNSLHGVGSPEVKEFLLSLGVDREINSDNMKLTDDN